MKWSENVASTNIDYISKIWQFSFKIKFLTFPFLIISLSSAEEQYWYTAVYELYRVNETSAIE